MDPGDWLVRAAMERFGNLRPAEAKILRAVAAGEVADVADRSGDETLTRESAWGCWEKWGEHRSVRAEVLRWLLVDEESSRRVHAHGVLVTGARIEGMVDLAGSEVRQIVNWQRCALPDGLMIQDCRVPFLVLDGSHVGPIGGDRLRAEHGVFLRGGMVAKGEVRLLGAKIGGNLECDGSTFENPPGVEGGSGRALTADGIDVTGDVVLRGGMVVKGEVRLLGAKIGGDLSCSGSTFENPPGVVGGSGWALRADGIDVTGGVLLCDKMVVKGEVWLVGAKIGGVLDCRGSTFENPPGVEGGSGWALSADGIDVTGDVFLRPYPDSRTLGRTPTSVRGSISLVGVRVRGDMQAQGLICEGGLDMDRGEFFGTFWLNDDTKITGIFDCSDAVVARLHDSKGAWNDCMQLNLHGFRYGSFTDECQMTAAERIEWVERGMKDEHGVYRFSPLPYEQLARVFVGMGRGNEAIEVKKAMYRAQRRAEWTDRLSTIKGFHQFRIWIWRWLMDLALGCGFHIERPGFALSGLLLLGTSLFWLGDQAGLMVPASEDVLVSDAYIKNGTPPTGYQSLNPLMYSADAMLPIIDLHQERFWLPDATILFSWGWWLRVYLWVHIAAGWVGSTLLVIGLTGLVKPEVRREGDDTPTG